MAASLALLFSAAALQAQPPDATSLPELTGRNATQSTEGSIEDADPAADGRHYDDYRLHLARGEIVQIDMESAQFDTYLELRRRGESAPVASNDDRIGGSPTTNSRLIFSAPVDGDYIVRAQDFFEGRGHYKLTVLGLTAAMEAHGLADGTTSGAIRSESPVAPDPDRPGRGFRYESYAFEGAAQARISIDMISAQIDSRLELLDTHGSVIQTDNNGGQNLNARIVTVLPERGIYTVRASTPSEQTGEFTLVLHRTQPVRSGRDIPQLVIGQTISGTLTDASQVRIRRGELGRIDFFYDLYTLQVTVGQPVTLIMRSSNFDAALEAGINSPQLGFAAAEANDNGGRGTNARLVLEPQRSGQVFIRARGTGAGVGDYTLQVVAGDTRAASPDD